MAKLFDQNNQPVDVPDQQVTQGLISGQYGTDKATVTVRSQAGKVYDVPTENLAKFNESMGGVHVLSDQELAQHQAQKDQAATEEKYGGVGSQLAAGAISAADALTLGLGSGIAGAVGGEDTRQYIRNVEAANPLSSGLGTVLGLVAPAILSGGASLAEEAPEAAGLLGKIGGAITAPARALGELGGAASTATREALGGGTLARLAGGGVQGSIEGAVYGAGSQLSEDVIQDKQLTAERMLASVGRGALFGGGLGLGGSLLGVAAEKGVQGLADASEGTGLSAALEKQAADFRFKSTGAKTKEFRMADKSGLDSDEIGRWLKDEAPAFNDGRDPVSREGIIEAAENAMKDAGPKIDGHVAELDRQGGIPNGEGVFNRVRDEVIDPLAKSIDPRVQNVGHFLDTMVTNTEAKFNESPSFKRLLDMRREIDASIDFNKADPAQITANQALRQARGVIEDEIGKQGTAVLGDGWRKGYDAAKLQYRMANKVSEITQSAQQRIAGHQFGASLSDKIIGAHGLTALALGNPVAAAGALGASAANHLITRYGDYVASKLLDKLSGVEAVRGVSFDFAGETNKAVSSFLNTTHEASAGAMTMLPHSFDKKKKEIDALASNPQLFTEAIAPHLPKETPQTAALMTQTAQTQLAYLKQTMPQGIMTTSTFTPQITQPPSKLAKHDWLEKVGVWEDPLSVVKDMQKGALTPGKADALKTMYPKIFEDIQKQIVTGISEKAAKGKEASYKARVQMGVLFGVATDATMTPEFIQSQQALYAQGPTPQRQQGMPGSTSNLLSRAPATAAKMQLAGPQQIGTEAQRIEENRGVPA